MLEFEVKKKDGQVYRVRAENYERAYAAVNGYDEPANPEGIPWSEVPEDVARSAAAGGARGVIGIAGQGGDLRGTITNSLRTFGVTDDQVRKAFKPPMLKATDNIADLLMGKKPEMPGSFGEVMLNAVGDTANILNPGFGMVSGPSSREIYDIVSDAIRPAPTLTDVVMSRKPETFMDYKAKGNIGHAVGTAAEIAPSLALGKGTLGQKLLALTGATAGSEGAGYATKDTWLEPWARTLAAITGAMATHKGGQYITAQPPEGLNRPSTVMLRNAMPDDMAEFKKLGPEAMTVDASPSMTGLGQGVVVSPGAAKNQLVKALAERDAGRSDRLQADAVGAMGLPQDPVALHKRIDDAVQTVSSPMYAQAKQNAPQLPITEKPTSYGPPGLNDVLAQQLTQAAEKLPPAQRTAFLKEFDQLDDALSAGNPQLAATRLHNLRKYFDGLIEYDPRAVAGMSSADRALQTVYRDWRATIDDILKNRIPGFKEADDVVSTGKRMQEDLEYGRNALEGGKNAIWPATYRAELVNRNQGMVQEGMKADVNTAMGTQANDLPALRKKVGGEGDFNRSKIADTFGQQAVDSMAGGVNRETTFAKTYSDIDRNSQTAQRQAAAKAVEGPDAPRFNGSETVTGLLLKGGSSVVNRIFNKVMIRSSEPTREALVQALMKKGPQAVALMEEIGASTHPNLTALTKALIALGASTDARLGIADQRGGR